MLICDGSLNDTKRSEEREEAGRFEGFGGGRAQGEAADVMAVVETKGRKSGAATEVSSR